MVLKLLKVFRLIESFISHRVDMTMILYKSCLNRLINFPRFNIPSYLKLIVRLVMPIYHSFSNILYVLSLTYNICFKIFALLVVPRKCITFLQSRFIRIDVIINGVIILLDLPCKGIVDNGFIPSL